MEENSNTKKTQVYNVIILDKSGSMDSIREATVGGFNETLAGIKKAQEKYAETQEHFITLVAFCGCEKKVVYDNVPVSEAKPLTIEDYVPCCMTPLYDAIGFTLRKMQKHVSGIEGAVGVATIITDGYENASVEYDFKGICKLIDELKNNFWTFTYMGALHDVNAVASSIGIKNARCFAHDSEGAMEGMTKERDTRANLYGRLNEARRCNRVMPSAAFSSIADEAFEEVNTPVEEN